MKKQLIYLLVILFQLSTLTAQTSFLTDDGVAVFNPEKLDSASVFPSLALIKELVPIAEVPPSWKIKPVFTLENGKSVARFSYSGVVDFYGTGEVKGDLNRKDSTVTLWNTDNYTYTSIDNGRRLYQSHPWVLGVRADGTSFGIMADNTWKQDISLKNDIMFSSDAPSFRVIVIEKENPLEVLKELSKLIGTIQLPPLWAIGYQQSKYTYTPDRKVMQLADDFRKHQIPCDVIWMDIDYMDKFKVFTFDSLTFPNPKWLNNYIQRKNFKAVYMIDPGVKVEKGYDVFDSGLKGNHWVKTETGKNFVGKVWPGDCVFPDFTRPETQRWWADLYKDFMANDIDGVWNDMNEPSVFDGPDATMPATNFHQGGEIHPAGSHLRYHNVYGMLMVKSSLDGLLAANPDKRPFILSRSNFLGGQRYAATWTGDNKSTWEYLKMSIPMSINLSLSGQPFNGPDIGGFEGNCNADLLGHWMAIGAYYPFSRNHTSNNTVDQEPWAFGKQIEDVSRTALNRRYQLLPYIYSLFRESSLEGTPIMQPLFFADFADKNLRNEQQAFLLGSNLMIVPRWAKDVKLPKQKWEQIKFESTDDGYQANVYLRPGAIVPMGKIIQSTVDYKTDSITLLINPDKNGYSNGSLYSDKGDGFEYKNGEYSVHSIITKKIGSNKISLEIKQTEGNIVVKRYYRVGLVQNNKIRYSDWTNDTKQVVRFK